MRPDSKNRRHNLSLSDILVSSTLKLKVLEKENLGCRDENSNKLSPNKKSGLRKSQVIKNKNISKKDVETLSVRSALKVHNNKQIEDNSIFENRVRHAVGCLLYTSPSPRDKRQSRMPSSA